jgi:hypothetical protein
MVLMDPSSSRTLCPAWLSTLRASATADDSKVGWLAEPSKPGARPGPSTGAEAAEPSKSHREDRVNFEEVAVWAGVGRLEGWTRTEESDRPPGDISAGENGGKASLSSPETLPSVSPWPSEH